MSFREYYKIKKEDVCAVMSMYRSYLLKNQFWAKKGNEKNPFSEEKVFIKHTDDNGGIYAIIQDKGIKRGVKIIVNGEEHWFNNFDMLDNFLNQLNKKQDDFAKILKRKNISQKLRMLDI